jgi:pimeloyl-ACP methyl ester carboxylesterase
MVICQLGNKKMQVAVDDLNINFQVHGNGQPLVILPGWRDRSDNWYSVAQLLANRFQVFVIDLPGFGISDAPKTTWSVDEYKNTVLGFIKEMDIEKPILMGHSHGGKIACLIAAEGDRNKCRALILVSSSGVDKPSLVVHAKILWFKIIKLLSKPLGKLGDKIVDYYRGKLGSRDYQEAGSLRATMVKVVNHKIFSILPKINVPTAIFWGNDDKILNVKQAKIFEKLIKNSYIRLIWEADHHPHLSHPQELADIAGDFLADL